MKYKILVNTSRFMSGTAVHNIVIDFESQHDADVAFDNLARSSLQATVVKLYDPLATEKACDKRKDL